MRVDFTTRGTCLTPRSPQPRASSEGSLSGVLPNDWKISAFLWSVPNALVRSPMQESNQRIRTGVYFFILLSIQLDNALRGRSPPMLVVSGGCTWGRSTGPAPAWSPLLPGVLLEPVTHCSIPKLHTHLFQHQLVMWCLKHQIFFPCLSTLQLRPVRLLCSTQNKHPNVRVNPSALWDCGVAQQFVGWAGTTGFLLWGKNGGEGQWLVQEVWCQGQA